MDYQSTRMSVYYQFNELQDWVKPRAEQALVCAQVAIAYAQTQTQTAFEWTVNEVLSPLASKIAEIAEWILDKISAAGEWIQDVLVPIIQDRINDLITAIFENVIYPAMEQLSIICGAAQDKIEASLDYLNDTLVVPFTVQINHGYETVTDFFNQRILGYPYIEI